MITSEILNEKWNSQGLEKTESPVNTFIDSSGDNIDVMSRLEANVRRIRQLNSRLNFLLSEVKDLVVK